MKGKSNPVAKYLRTFNKATVQRDRKKDAKKGASKYKKDIYKEEGDLEKARDNVGSDSCWDGYKATGTKKKGGKLVPDCKKESIGEGTDKLISSHVRGDINIKTVRRGTSMSSPIFVKVTDGKKTHEMGPYKSAAEAKAAVNKMHPAPKGKRTMESIDEGFSKAQIEALRKQFSTLKTVDPTGPAYKKMTKFLQGRTAKELEGIAKAKIKFLSQTASSVLKSKHGVTIPFKDVYGESVEEFGEAKKPVSQMTPKEKAADAKRRKEYNAYQKSKRNEGLSEGISVEQFDRLKSKQKVTIDFSSVMGGSGEKEFIVTRKSKLKGGKIEKITLKSVKNPMAQASYLYKRDGKNVSMAQGDMAVSAKSLKEGMRVEPYDVNALMEKAIEIQYTDKPDFGEDSALGYGRKEGYKEVGVIGTSARTAMVIFKLNAFDKKYTKSVRLKAGEEIFRYTSRGTVAGSIMPLIKVNMKRGLAYYLTQESSSGEIDEPVFETKSQKLKFIRLLTSAYKPAHIVKEDVEQIDEISDKLVKSYRAKAVQDMDNRYDKRGSNLSSRQSPAGRKKLAKSITKTKSNLDKAKTSVIGRDKKVAKAQASRDAAVSSFKDRKDNERKINNRDRGIARTDRKADAADKKKPGSAAKRGLRGFGGYGESVEQIDEIVAKQNKNGEIELTKAKYAKIHRDHKGKWPDGGHYVTQHQGRQGMTQVPVKFVKEDAEQVDEASPSHAAKSRAGMRKIANAAKRDAYKAAVDSMTQAKAGLKLAIKDEDDEGRAEYFKEVIRLQKLVADHANVVRNIKEDVEQIDEIVAKLNKNGEIEMTKKKYAKVHKDFKGKWPDGEHYVTQHMGRQGMTQVPVKFVKEDAELDEKMDANTKKTARSLMRLGDKPRLAVKTAKAGAKNSAATKTAYRKAYESVEQFDENQDIKATAPKAKATKVGQRATTPSEMGRKYPDNKWVVKKNTGTSKAYRPLEWVLESVEQTDEMSNRLLNRYSDAAKKDTKKDRAKGMRKARNIRTQRANKGLFGSDIGEEVEQVDELSKATSISYLKKANKDQNSRSDTLSNKSMNREVGMSRAAKNVNKKGGLSTVDKLRHRTRGFIGVNKESVEHLDELTQREKDMIADRKAKRDTKAGRKDKNTRLLPKTTTYVGTSKEDKQSIVMQLRRAQDSANFGNGSFGIRVSPVKDAATVNLKKPQIDKLLAVYDKLEKPEQKRKYRITLLKTLRSMQQKGK